jgi:hemolysin-activating ACP:hemolysin acyltransferase
MRHYIPAFAALAVSFMSSALVPALKADQSNKKTEITIDQPIAVEGTVLSPGSYVMKVLDSPGDRTIVQIFDADTNHLINTIFAIPAYWVTPADESTFEFYESRDGQPTALHTWFYPADTNGFAFRDSRSFAAE